MAGTSFPGPILRPLICYGKYNIGIISLAFVRGALMRRTAGTEADGQGESTLNNEWRVAHSIVNGYAARGCAPPPEAVRRL